MENIIHTIQKLALKFRIESFGFFLSVLILLDYISVFIAMGQN